MRVIYRYEVQVGHRFSLELPKNAKILSVQMQGNGPQMWAMFESDESSKEIRKFALFGTGHKIPDNLTLLYIGTFQIDEESLVFHLFEIKDL